MSAGVNQGISPRLLQVIILALRRENSSLPKIVSALLDRHSLSSFFSILYFLSLLLSPPFSLHPLLLELSDSFSTLFSPAFPLHIILSPSNSLRLLIIRILIILYSKISVRLIDIIVYIISILYYHF